MPQQSLFSAGPGRLLLVSGTLAMVALGASQALYGPFFPHFSATLGVTPSQLGMLPSVHFAGATIGVLGGGAVARRIGYRPVLTTGAVVLALGFIAVAAAGSWPTVLAGGALLGFGFGILVTFNILVDEAFGRMGAAALQLINAGFSVGAISAPLLASVSLSFGGTWFAFGVGAVVAVVLGVVMERGSVPVDALLTEETSSAAGRSRAGDGTDVEAGEGTSRAAERETERGAGLPRREVSFLLPLAIFLPLYLVYPGAEASFSNWMPLHLFSIRSSAIAAAVASGFWAAFTAGRLLAVPVSMYVHPGVLTTVALIVAGVAAGVAQNATVAPVGYLVAGIALGPVFPAGLSWLRRRYPSHAGRVGGIVIAAGGVGGMVIPPLVGVVVERWSPAVVPIALTVILGVAGFLAIGIALSARLHRSDRDSRRERLPTSSG